MPSNPTHSTFSPFLVSIIFSYVTALILLIFNLTHCQAAKQAPRSAHRPVGQEENGGPAALSVLKNTACIVLHDSLHWALAKPLGTARGCVASFGTL